MTGRRISGYAALFGAPDAQADAIVAGAFRATLRARGDRLPLLWQHAMAEPLGHVVAAREDGRGLWFEAALATTRRAADALALIERGSLRECSIGFVPRRVRFERRDGRSVRLIDVLDLVEISLVTLAANPNARLTALDGRPLERPAARPRAPATLRRRFDLALPPAPA